MIPSEAMNSACDSDDKVHTYNQTNIKQINDNKFAQWHAEKMNGDQKKRVEMAFICILLTNQILVSFCLIDCNGKKRERIVIGAHFSSSF